VPLRSREKYKKLVLLYVAFAVAVLSCAKPFADSLPFKTDFDHDPIGRPPIALKQADRPTELLVRGNASVLVQSSANGIDTQPTHVVARDTNSWAAMVYSFYPLSTRRLRVEATVSIDRYTAGYFMETALVHYGPVVSRLLFMEDGSIQTETKDRKRVGGYLPNTPFRVRMDIDIPSQTYDVIIDTTVNGFHDDVGYENLLFTNSHITLSSVGAAYFGINTFPVASAGVTSIAYDDIYIEVIHEDTALLPAINTPLHYAATKRRTINHEK